MTPRWELVLPDRSRVAVDGTLTIGRDPRSTVRLGDPSVSRRHVQLSPAGDDVLLEDVGSSHGTWVDGRRLTEPATLRDGAHIRIGDQEVVVELRRGAEEAGRTIVVPVGASRAMPVPAEAQRGPRLRSGYAVKRLAASEGPERWVVRDLHGDRFLRLGDDGQLLELFDGRHSVQELIGDAQRLFGVQGPARLAALLSELAERGLLAGEEDSGAPEAAPASRTRGLLKPREWIWPGAADWFARLYARGGFVLFTPAAFAVLAAIAVTGLGVFGYLVIGRYGTPFVVASKVGIGGLVFLLGRLAVAAVHETAHGLTMASYGRRVGRSGFKVLLIFPYVFVDTSEAWFEGRRRRIAVSAAGPVSDATLGAAFSWACLAIGPGVLRAICFQLAFAAYVGALVNMNPFVERDGYHMLSDALREPGLRRRAREELRHRMRTRDGTGASKVLTRYALAGLAWSVVAAGAAIVLSLRYRAPLEALLPAPVVWAMLAAVWAAALAPAVTVLAGPLLERVRDGRRRDGSQ